MNRKTWKTIGTYAVVGIASMAGSALWTNVLEFKYQEIRNRIARPNAENLIDFSKEKRKISH